jgi:hypothetical protein
MPKASAPNSLSIRLDRPGEVAEDRREEDRQPRFAILLR